MQTLKKLSNTYLLFGAGLLVLLLLALTLFNVSVHSQQQIVPARKMRAQQQNVVVHKEQVQQKAVSQPAIITAPVSYGGSYIGTARQAAASAGINPDMFVRQIDKESGFNPNASSPVGAIGIAQFMPATAASMGINPYDPVQSLYGAARHMASLSSMYGGNYAKALAAYNAGPGNVNSAVSAGGANWLAFTPSETQNYVNAIMG